MMLTIDGSYGEGGGQILRSALTLAAITGEPVQLTAIRANRRKPGLRPQHLTAVRATAALCNARLDGAHLNSQTLTFAPQREVRSGVYTFDVSEAVSGNGTSAGSVALVLQTILMPLALADGSSRVTLRGGTVVPHSPPAPYIEKVYLPTLFRMGVKTRFHHRRWGFYPSGGGEVTLEVRGNASLRSVDFTERGDPQRVDGVAFVSRLPSHIPQRMSDRARSLLRESGWSAHIDPRHVTAQSIGAGIFLLARYERAVAGFTKLGRKGLPSEEVAEDACVALLMHNHRQTPIDSHLGDQLVIPFVLSTGKSRAFISKITRHLMTNVWVAQHFNLTSIRVDGELGKPGMLIVGE